jgi:predicted NAD-dependent protein-ADP-ribosyltransferase YbiA (DUF1768 family)
VIEFKESVLKSGDSALFVEAAFDDYWGSGLDKRGNLKSSVTTCRPRLARKPAAAHGYTDFAVSTGQIK